jgi:hypothetical protein
MLKKYVLYAYLGTMISVQCALSMDLNQQLFDAICYGNNIVPLLEQQADVNTYNSSSDLSALSLAIYFNRLEAARHLLLYQADVNFQSKLPTCKTALFLAAWIGNHDAAHLLLQHKADVDLANAVGMTPLMEAARQMRTAMVVQLLEGGADAAVQSADGKTATDVAFSEAIQKIIIGHIHRQEDNERVRTVVAIRSLADTPLSLIVNELLFLLLEAAFPDADKDMWQWHTTSTESQ